MKNPLIKRIPRELKSDWHKYFVIIIFMVVMIGVISGMYVGHDSMLSAIYEGREELNLEDGSFELSKEASDELIKALETGKKADVKTYYINKGNKEADEAIEASFDKTLKEVRESEEFKKTLEEAYKEAHEEVLKKVNEEWDEVADRYSLNDEAFFPVSAKIYDHYFREENEDSNLDGETEAKVRIYKSDSLVDMASFNKGRAPQNEKEIAIDRMHADNVGVGIGDHINVGGKDFEIVGLLSYVNYNTLHESNTDLMFDAFGFDVAMVTPKAFDNFSSRVHFSYAFKYLNEPKDKIESADYAENYLKTLITQALVYDNEIEDFLPEYLRQTSNFALSDIEGDAAGTGILCYILIAVIAFIFAITISNTIDKEASVIGTLRASGYSRSELLVHYMSMPVAVTILGAIVGNVLGYTLFKDVAVNLYFNSYSLPECKAVWSNTAIVKTTVIPLILMFFINLFVIVRKLKLSPLRFLRHDLSKHKRTKARRIPKWSFIRRFRLRNFFQNLSNYMVLIFGVVFIELMMCFAFGLPDALNHYAEEAPNMMFAKYQYILMNYKDDDSNVIKTSEESAEAFGMTNLLYPKKKSEVRSGMGSGGDESVTVYGIKDNSKYVSLRETKNKNGAFVSSAFSKKFDLKPGDVITLNEEYENKSYEFSVEDIVDYEGGIAIFLKDDFFNETFDKDDAEFSGYFSKNEITDIKEKYIATVITEEDILKVTNQLMHSMGGMMGVFKVALIILSASLIYLLAKIIIERNEQSISMVKILGFKNGEIGSLYIAPTAIVVVICASVAFVIGYFLMTQIFKIFMLQMDGYFAFYMRPQSMVLAVLYLLIGYAFVSVVDFIRIKKIPLSVALKNVE